MSEVRNWFQCDWVGTRYASARPRIHARIAERLRDATSGGLRRALDVGCGTGLSSSALRELAAEVFGADMAAGMLAQAPRDPGLHWVRARAEALPFRDESFDLLTVGCAWHWCEPERLEAEALRLLRPRGWLAVYDNGFLGQAPESTELTDWLAANYYSRIPRTSRHPMLGSESPVPRGFAAIDKTFVDEWFAMDLTQLVTFLTTQSTTIAAVETGTLSLEDAEAALWAGLARFFPAAAGARVPLHFGGPLCILRRGRT